MAAAESSELGGLPSVVVHRRVEWHDTDAAGHHHHGAVLRWVESAETVLLERRSATELYGRSDSKTPLTSTIKDLYERAAGSAGGLDLSAIATIYDRKAAGVKVS